MPTIVLSAVEIRGDRVRVISSRPVVRHRSALLSALDRNESDFGRKKKKRKTHFPQSHVNTVVWLFPRASYAFSCAIITERIFVFPSSKNIGLPRRIDIPNETFNAANDRRRPVAMITSGAHPGGPDRLWPPILFDVITPNAPPFPPTFVTLTTAGASTSLHGYAYTWCNRCCHYDCYRCIDNCRTWERGNALVRATRTIEGNSATTYRRTCT